MKERLGFMIEPNTDSTATVCMCWEKLKITFDVMANTKGMIKKSIEDFTNGDWRAYATAAELLHG